MFVELAHFVRSTCYIHIAFPISSNASGIPIPKWWLEFGTYGQNFLALGIKHCVSILRVFSYKQFSLITNGNVVGLHSLNDSHWSANYLPEMMGCLLAIPKAYIKIL